MDYSVRIGLLAGGPGFPYGLSHKIPPEGEIQMAYSLFDAAVTPCAQQLGALAGIIDKAAAHCAANKIEESALAVREIMVFLHSHGVGTARAVRIYKTYGPDAIQVMTEAYISVWKRHTLRFQPSY